MVRRSPYPTVVGSGERRWFRSAFGKFNTKEPNNERTSGSAIPKGIQFWNFRNALGLAPSTQVAQQRLRALFRERRLVDGAIQFDYFDILA